MRQWQEVSGVSCSRLREVRMTKEEEEGGEEWLDRRSDLWRDGQGRRVLGVAGISIVL